MSRARGLPRSRRRKSLLKRVKGFRGGRSRLYKTAKESAMRADAYAHRAKVVSADGTHSSASRVHDLARLPREFIGLPNGHNGSHQFLVDDFVTACVEGSLPPNNVWDAARYNIPGLIAHESAGRGGELLEVPDLGGPPGP